MENLPVNLSVLVQATIAFFTAFGLAFWVSLIIWTYNDIRARTRDIFAILLAVLLVAVFNILGVPLYLLLRPRETLAEQYERSLEEEALLQEI